MDIVSNIKATIIRQIGIGQGLNSTVFLAYDPQLDAEIAIKVIPKSNFRSPMEYFTEARTIYSNRSPRVVPVMYAGEDTTEIRLAMPFFEKGSVQDYIKSGSLSNRQVIRWGQNFLSGLQHVHAQGYTHLDIKPNNLLVHSDGSVVLSDFGQSRPVNQYGIAPIPPMYLWHMPPEVFQNTGGLPKQSDLYQAGLTLYRMCNGEDLYDRQKPVIDPALPPQSVFLFVGQHILNSMFPNRQAFRPHVPQRLRRIIRKALSVSFSDRYKTVVELMNALGEVDSLLDWRYDSSQGMDCWIEETLHHRKEIKIEQHKKGWFVSGQITRLSDGLTRRKHAWCSGPLSTKRKAEDFVTRAFRAMEVK